MRKFIFLVCVLVCGLFYDTQPFGALYHLIVWVLMGSMIYMICTLVIVMTKHLDEFKYFYKSNSVDIGDDSSKSLCDYVNGYIVSIAIVMMGIANKIWYTTLAFVAVSVICSITIRLFKKHLVS
jgi:hypothetical protein